jgi:hypothetical protein
MEKSPIQWIAICRKNALYERIAAEGGYIAIRRITLNLSGENRIFLKFLIFTPAVARHLYTFVVVSSNNLWIPLTFELSTCNKSFLFMFIFGVFLVNRCNTSFSHLQWRVCYLLIDIPLVSFAKAIAKTASVVFLFQYVDSVLYYILSEYLFFDLSLHSKQF